ncbi:MAG: hypothetical protein ABIR46_01660, partial [Candidatus Saccharimonadales bacterium]
KITVAGRTDWFPSWFNKSASAGTTMRFDKVSKKKATDCTPETAVISLTVTKTVDPITKKDRFLAPIGYDASSSDDIHSCDDIAPFVTTIVYDDDILTTTLAQGTHSLANVEVKVDNVVIYSNPVTASGPINIPYDLKKKQIVVVTLTDSALLVGTKTWERP